MDVMLRRATDADMAIIMSWRSNPDVYAGNFYTQKKPLTWDEHKTWWESRNKDWREFIIEVTDCDLNVRPVGIVTVGQLDYWECEIGIAVGEVTLWGRGVAAQALSLVLAWLKERGRDYVRTTILDSNKRSRKLFEKHRFKKIGAARPGESLYRMKL